MNLKYLLLTASAVILSGCATAPSEIPAAMVEDSIYKNMNCQTLLLSAQKEGRNLEQVSADQRSARNWDIALNILILPGVGAMTGDSEREVAEAKGRVLAIENEYAARCSGSVQEAESDADQGSETNSINTSKSSTETE